MDQQNNDYQQITKEITLIKGLNPGPFTLTGTNTYLVGTGQKRILIDAGQNIPQYKTNLQNILKDQQCTISQVLITHAHIDHTHGLEQVLQITGQDIKIFKFQNQEEDEKLEKQLGFKYNYVKDGDTIETDEFSFKVFEMKGHCKDHITFYIEKLKIFFSGDFILGGSSSIVSDLSEQFKNFETNLELDIELLLPGHGIVIKGKEGVKNEIQKNKQNREKRQQQVIDSLKQNENTPKTIHDIFLQVYPDIKQENLIQGAKGNIKVTLQKLINDNLVNKIEAQNEEITYQILS